MNQGWTYTDNIRKSAAGQTVLDYYAQRYTHSTRQQWQARIAQGQILLNNQPTEPHIALQAGQSLSYRRAPWKEPEAPLTINVLYEDDALWAIYKPAGLPVLPGGNFLEHTVLHQMRLRSISEGNSLASNERSPNNHPAPVHRLGRGTSGVMLVAKSPTARTLLSQQFRRRTAQSISPRPVSVRSASTQTADVQTTAAQTAATGADSPPALQKVYRALIGPTTPEGLSDRFTCRYPIGKLPYPGLSHLYGHSPTGLVAISHGHVLQRTTQATLLQVTIATGRPHQIRIHLAAAGYPLLGDPLYAPGGTPIADGSAMPGDGGYHLHAHTLRFTHPHTGKPVFIEAPPPPALCLSALGTHPETPLK